MNQDLSMYRPAAFSIIYGLENTEGHRQTPHGTPSPSSGNMQKQSNGELSLLLSQATAMPQKRPKLMTRPQFYYSLKKT